MKSQKANNKKKSQKADPFPHCEDFQKMAEMMKNCCHGERDAVNCCSIMREMMGQGRETEAKETKETQKPQKGKKTHENSDSYV